MLPDRVSNPGPRTYESGALPIALRGLTQRKESKCWHAGVGSLRIRPNSENRFFPGGSVVLFSYLATPYKTEQCSRKWTLEIIIIYYLKETGEVVEW